MNFTSDLLPDLLVGIILAGFAWAFKSWAETLRQSTDKILNRLNQLAVELHTYRLEQERRVTKVETELLALDKQVTKMDKQYETE